MHAVQKKYTHIIIVRAPLVERKYVLKNIVDKMENNLKRMKKNTTYYMRDVKAE